MTLQIETLRGQEAKGELLNAEEVELVQHFLRTLAYRIRHANPPIDAAGRLTPSYYIEQAIMNIQEYLQC